MSKFKHLNSDQRVNIASLLNEGRSCRYIAKLLHVAPSTIHREILQNSNPCSNDACYGHCPLLKNKSSTCNCYKNKDRCLYTKIFYNSSFASNLASYIKYNANSGPRMSTSEFNKLDDTLYDFVEVKGQSVEAAWNASDILQAFCPLTIRRWIYMDRIKTKIINLKRKKNYHVEPKYDYSKQKNRWNGQDCHLEP